MNVNVQLKRPSINVGIGSKKDISADIDGRKKTYPIYGGPVEVIPSSEAQLLQTKDLVVKENIIVHPIPSNYGLITWDGSTLTVS